MSQTLAARPVGSLRPSGIPWAGLTAVLMGTFISTLNGRLSSFGLADIRGALHAGFDEGAWITTAQSAAQMLIAPIAIWIGNVYGPRRALFGSALAFAIISSLIPASPDLYVFLVLQFAAGLASGFFVPLTLSFILTNLKPPYWAWGIAIYALNLEFSVNIAASMEAWYVDHLNWHWIFWQNIPFAVVMAACVYFGARDQLRPDKPPPDWFGFAFGGAGLALLFAAFDQGNRLDWLNSGLIVGLLLGGTILMGCFFVHEARTDHPAVNLKVVFSEPLPRLFILISILRLTLLATAYLIPQFLQVVRGFRALEVGQSLMWIALPQLIICPLAALMLRRTDPRLVSIIGFIFISTACLIVAYTMTPVWGPDQFLRTQLLQAVGQSFALSGMVFYAVLHLKPQDALTFGAGIQMARLMGGEVGLAFVVTFERMRVQTASNHIGRHVGIGDGNVLARLQGYAGAIGRGNVPLGNGRALVLLDHTIRNMATIQGIIDSFIALGFLTALAMIVVVAQRAAPIGPASYKPLFERPTGSAT